MEKIKALVEEYGSIAIAVYFTIFGVVLAGFFFSIMWLSGSESGKGFGASLFAAWVATKVTQLPRIGATLALTPIIGMAIRKRRGTGPDGDSRKAENDKKGSEP
jgi:hypothetical protein